MDSTKPYAPVKIPMSAWAEEDQPRHKILLKGRSTLSDAELLSLLIGCGNEEENALDIARNMLSGSNNSLTEFGKLSSSDLMRHKGIGQSKAVAIVAAFELGRRRKNEDAITRNQITNSMDIFNIMHPYLGDLTHEEFWVLFLNRANRVMGKHQVSSGGMTGTVVDPKIIFKQALDAKATTIVLTHNHPSGNTRPSQQDVDLTKKLVDGGKLLEISVIDHIIICNHSFFSFADEGMI
jgi:DNA repair protein RadC